MRGNDGHDLTPSVAVEIRHSDRVQPAMRPSDRPRGRAQPDGSARRLVERQRRPARKLAPAPPRARRAHRRRCPRCARGGPRTPDRGRAEARLTNRRGIARRDRRPRWHRRAPRGRSGWWGRSATRPRPRRAPVSTTPSGSAPVGASATTAWAPTSRNPTTPPEISTRRLRPCTVRAWTAPSSATANPTTAAPGVPKWAASNASAEPGQASKRSPSAGASHARRGADRIMAFAPLSSFSPPPTARPRRAGFKPAPTWRFVLISSSGWPHPP